MTKEKYKVAPGPEAYLSPAAAMMGVVLPDEGGALVEGEIVPREAAIEAAARKLAEAKRPAVCPGPTLLWQWTDGAEEAAAAIKEMAETCDALILPMIDYSAKRIRVDTEISPNHPNATLLHNDIDVCVFAGVHSHYANTALRLIRGGTSCYTIALSNRVGVDEAMIALRDVDTDMVRAITDRVKVLKK